MRRLVRILVEQRLLRCIGLCRWVFSSIVRNRGRLLIPHPLDYCLAVRARIVVAVLPAGGDSTGAEIELVTEWLHATRPSIVL